VVFLYDNATPPFVRAMFRAQPNRPMTFGPLARGELDLDPTARPVRAAAVQGTCAARIRRVENEATLRLEPAADGGLRLTLVSELMGADGTPIPGAPVRETTGMLRPTTDPYLTLTGEGRCLLRLFPVGRYLLVLDEENRCADGGETIHYTGLYLRNTGSARAPVPSAAPAAAQAVAGYVIEPNQSRKESGSPYRSVRMGEVSAQACASACAADRPCMGFTIQPGEPGVSGPVCHLLQALGTPVAQQGAVSGVRQR